MSPGASVRSRIRTKLYESIRIQVQRRTGLSGWARVMALCELTRVRVWVSAGGHAQDRISRTLDGRTG